MICKNLKENGVSMLNLDNLSPNEKVVYDKIQKDGPFTISGLMDCFDFKLSTLNRIITSLKTAELIVETGYEESTGGRKPIIYDINTAKEYIIGIDISRTHTRVVLCDMKIRLKGSAEFLEVHSKPEKVLQDIKVYVDKLLKDNGLSLSDVYCVGAGVTGPYDRETGELLEVDMMHEWSGFPVRRELEKIFPCPVFVDNGAHAAVLGEYLYGMGKNYKNVSFFDCEVNIRCAHISSGVLIRPADGSEDAISHITIDMMGERCTCGRRGCLKCYVSTLTISNNIRRRIRNGEDTILKGMDPQLISYVSYTEAAAKGDALALDELAKAGDVFGVGLADYVTLLNPRLVIISGPLPILSKEFYNAAINRIKQELHGINKSGTIFVCGGHSSKFTIATGAAAMAFESMMKSPLTK
jgi:predicted NBD/HSP70 family sugar kinase